MFHLGLHAVTESEILYKLIRKYAKISVFCAEAIYVTLSPMTAPP